MGLKNAPLLFAAHLLFGQGQLQFPAELTQILGRPTDRSLTVSVLSPHAITMAVLEYGTAPGRYTANKRLPVPAQEPVEIELSGLKPNTRYFYRLNGGEERSFHTQRAVGSAFTFGVQGDSHPERRNRMYHADLYRQTMRNVRRDQPDFYLMLGDDFNVDPLYQRQQLTSATVSALYAHQRQFLSLGAAPVFLVNGNHEQAARHLLDGTPASVPVLVGRARNLFYPLPAPDRFYTGDTEPVEHLGLPRDYYAFTWGDALFITLDPYWHSPVQIDAGLGGAAGERKRNQRRRGGWQATMGDAQYQWLRQTLERSQARYKFVFAHHVLGTGRGGVEMASLYEWGGHGPDGAWEFEQRRPHWELPIHQLFVKHRVNIFFQGHDHLFAKQEKDGVIYQAVPNPADSTYTAFNRDAYRTGHVLPNSGYLRVGVAPDKVTVQYVRSWLPDGGPNGEVAYSYEVPAL